MFKNIVLMFLMLNASASFVLAQDISVTAAVSPQKISLKEAAQLTVTVDGKVKVDAPQLPKIDGLDVRYLGPTSSFTFVNGQTSSSKSFIYSLFPLKTGHLQVPALTLTIEGADYTTKPIDLDIVDQPDGGSLAPAASSMSGHMPADQNIKDHVFLSVSTPLSQVYVGQKVPVSVKLLVNQLPIRNIQFPQMEEIGFKMDHFGQPQQYSKEINGTKFDVVDFATNIYPAGFGQLSIGPVQINGGLIYKTQESNNLFGNDFFNSFFDNVQERPIKVTSEGLKINVLDLPQEGKPANFSGAIGILKFEASISPAEVKAGDPVTLRMMISGDANIKSIQVPSINDERFKTYDPLIKDGDNTKAIEQVIIPGSADIKEVPVLSLDYFDPVEGKYKVLTQGPFPLRVAAPAAGQEFKAVGFNNLSPAALAPPVDYVEKYIKEPFNAALSLVKTWQFWLGLFILILLGGGVYALVRFKDRLTKDTAFASRLNAYKHAKQGMKEAESFLRSGLTQGFYNTVFKTLNNFIANKFQKPLGSLTWDNVRLLLLTKNVPPDLVSGTKEIFDSCDAVRFAGGAADSSRMTADLKKLQELIAGLEKHLK